MRIRGLRNQHEMRDYAMEKAQLMAMLDGEREVSVRERDALAEAYEAKCLKMLENMEMWKMHLEDALSFINFNPVADKVQKLEALIVDLRQQTADARRATEDKSRQLEAFSHRYAEVRDEGEALRAELHAVSQALAEAEAAAPGGDLWQEVEGAHMAAEEWRGRLAQALSDRGDLTAALKK